MSSFLGNPRVPLGLMFHHFHGEGGPRSPGSLSSLQFEALLNHVGMDRCISPDLWLDKLREGSLSESNLCLTFDDALLSQIDVALPVLDRLGLKAFWFVPSGIFEGHLDRLELYARFRNTCFPDLGEFHELFFDRLKALGIDTQLPKEWIAFLKSRFPFYSDDDARFRLLRDRVLTPAQYENTMDSLIRERNVSLEKLAEGLWMKSADLRRLSDSGHSVGLHSYSHPTTMASSSVERQRDEYERNFNHLSAVCGRAPRAMSHPCDSYSAETLRILKMLGIQCGFRSHRDASDKHGILNPSPLEMAREDASNIVRFIAA